MLFIIIFIFTFILSFILFWKFRKKPLFFISSIIFFNAAVLGLYYYQGTGQQVEKTIALQEKNMQVKVLLKSYKNTNAIIDAMKNAIEENKGNPTKASKGWYLLGRLYEAEDRTHMKNVQQPQRYVDRQATEAFKNAHRLAPQNFTYTFAYLQRLYADNNQMHTPEINALIKQMEQQQLNNPSVLDFLGYDAYEHGHYEDAIRYWEKLLPYLSDDPKTRQAILEAIGKAEKKLLK